MYQIMPGLLFYSVAERNDKGANEEEQTVESREEIRENNMLDHEKLKKTVSRILGNKRNKYVFYDQQEDVIKLINFVHNIQYENTKVPYNILIITDNAEKSDEFCENIDLVAEEMKVFEKKMVGCDIENWYSLNKSFEDMAQLYSCLVIKKVEINDLKNEKWEQMADMIRKDHTPSLIKIMCVTKEAAEFLRDYYEDVFYRFFANDYHILMSEEGINSNSIYKMFLEKLESEGYQINKEFDTGIKAYIETVYPKAVEREMSFINDLYDRVVRAVLSRTRVSKQIDAKCIPFYCKNKETVEKTEHTPSTVIFGDNKNKEIIKKTECPPSTMILENDKKEENVLFFNLSVLGKCIVSKYKGEWQVENGINMAYYTGISQLEAGTKQVLYTLALQGKKLDRIVMVESKRTRTDEHTDFLESFWDDSEKMKKYYTSSVCFYKQRIKDYIRRKESKKIFKEEEGTFYQENISYEDPFIDNVEYTEQEIESLFYDIPTYEIESNFADSKEENENFKCYEDQSLELFAEIIHGIQGNSRKKINLYVDMQGGFRSAVSQTDAVLELLKDRNVKIRGRYAIKNFIPNGQKIHEVKLVDEEYKAYELVSAMTEFKRYGRGQGLTEFFAKDSNLETKEIVELIRRISGAISLCNVEEFESQIRELAEINEKLKDVQLNSQISIVFQDIIDDYMSLLRKESTTFDIVEWCVNKSFYQQAITLIESLMPKMLVECGFLYYNPCDYIDVVMVEKDNEVKEYRPICYICECDKKNKNQSWKDTYNLLFEKWIWCNFENDSKKKGYFGVSDIDWMNLSVDTDFKEISREFKNIKPVKWDEIRCNRQEKLKNIEYKKYTEGLENDTDAGMFCMFVALSRELKRIRNSINHASAGQTYDFIKDEGMEMFIKRMLSVYLALGKKLRLNERWIEEKWKKENVSPDTGMKVKFVAVEIGKNKKNIKGLVEGFYEGTIESAALNGLSTAQIGELCGKILQVTVKDINKERYILTCERDELEKAISLSSLKEKQVSKKGQEERLEYSMGNLFSQINLEINE